MARRPRPSQVISVFAGPEMERGGVRSAVFAAGIVLSPCVAWAEVMDKEPGLATLWTQALVLGVVGFLAWRRHWALACGATLIAALLVGGFHWELADPYVGPAIRQEAGRGYVVQAYASMLTCAALHVAGLAAFIRGRHLPKPRTLPEVAGQRTTR